MRLLFIVSKRKVSSAIVPNILYNTPRIVNVWEMLFYGVSVPVVFYVKFVVDVLLEYKTEM